MTWFLVLLETRQRRLRDCVSNSLRGAQMLTPDLWYATSHIQPDINDEPGILDLLSARKEAKTKEPEQTGDNYNELNNDNYDYRGQLWQSVG
jgi:hypothetical protein